jgi:hypothetical protein
MRPFLRRLGRFTVYTSGSLVAAAALALLYFHYMQHRRSGEPQRLLDRADRLSWNNQWLKAWPRFRGSNESAMIACAIGWRPPPPTP